MLFTSPEFIVLFGITFCIYYLPILRSHQVRVLLVASLIFYAWSSPALLLLLITSILINSLASYRVAYARSRQSRIMWATAGVVINVATLVIFKYGALTTNLFLRAAGVGETPVDGLAAALLHIPLPIGISFYTFEGISLLIDTLRQEQSVEQGQPREGWSIDPRFMVHLERAAFFIAFFPHLIAGPVLKAKSFFPQIAPKQLGAINWSSAMHALLVGYFLKVFVADNLHDYTFWLAFPYYQSQSTITNLALLYGYSIQIFADFAGYSLIAIGLAGILGYELMQNFNFPYISRSIAEFWRRWHISLSTWLRDYLYFPLGGNRKGEARTYLNLLIVMTLGGLWHGSAWSYAVWGLFHGTGLAIERLLRLDRPDDSPHERLSGLRPLIDIMRMAGTFIFVSIGWVFFKLPDFGQALDFFAVLGRNLQGAANLGLIVPILVYALPAVLYHLPQLPLWRWAERRPALFRVTGSLHWQHACMLLLLLLNPGSSEAFIYFQF